MNFIGRHKELKALTRVKNRGSASFVVIRGRRRIGKSRLVFEFSQHINSHYYSFVGLAPNDGITAEQQRKEFMRRFCEQFHLPSITLQDWGDIFSLLAKQVEQQNCIILLDEISWMAQGDPTFLPKLKTAWDESFSKNPNLMLILCGSISTWIEKNIISNTGYLGRPTRIFNLEELPLDVCNEFWGQHKDQISAYEKLKILSVTGGIPRYLEFIETKLSAEENIRYICFDKSSPLLNEFNQVFVEIFGDKNKTYRQIIHFLLDGAKTQTEILKLLEVSKSGDISDYLADLKLAGFIARDYTWDIKTNKISKLSQFRLKDNFIRFYLKHIEPNKLKIEQEIFAPSSLQSLPGWDSMMGLQFENLVVNNFKKLFEILQIPKEEVIFCNPYFQRHTKKHLSCQIDLLIQTRFNNVYVCEIKFHRHPIDAGIIQEVQEKISRLKLPKGFSYRPVLIHVNGVNDSVIDSQFFANIINFSEMLY